MGEITPLQVLWFVVTFITGAVMWAAQIGPKAAASNLADWSSLFGLSPPDWLRSKVADQVVQRGGSFLLAALSVVGAWIFWSPDAAGYVACVELIGFALFAIWRRSRPVGTVLAIVSFVTLGIALWILISPKTNGALSGTATPTSDDNKATVSAVPSIGTAQVTAPTKLIAGDTPDIPDDVKLSIARYVQLTQLIAEAKTVVSTMKELNAARRQWRNVGQVSMWSASIGSLKRIASLAYKNREIDSESAPDPAISEMRAPDESTFREDQGREKYQYRVAYFQGEHTIEQGEKLLSDMTEEVLGSSSRSQAQNGQMS